MVISSFRSGLYRLVTAYLGTGVFAAVPRGSWEARPVASGGCREPGTRVVGLRQERSGQQAVQGQQDTGPATGQVGGEPLRTRSEEADTAPVRDGVLQ